VKNTYEGIEMNNVVVRQTPVPMSAVEVSQPRAKLNGYVPEIFPVV